MLCITNPHAILYASMECALSKRPLFSLPVRWMVGLREEKFPKYGRIFQLDTPHTPPTFSFQSCCVCGHSAHAPTFSFQSRRVCGHLNTRPLSVPKSSRIVMCWAGLSIRESPKPGCPPEVRFLCSPIDCRPMLKTNAALNSLLKGKLAQIMPAYILAQSVPI